MDYKLNLFSEKYSAMWLCEIKYLNDTISWGDLVLERVFVDECLPWERDAYELDYKFTIVEGRILCTHRES